MNICIGRPPYRRNNSSQDWRIIVCLIANLVKQRVWIFKIDRRDWIKILLRHRLRLTNNLTKKKCKRNIFLRNFVFFHCFFVDFNAETRLRGNLNKSFKKIKSFYCQFFSQSLMAKLRWKIFYESTWRGIESKMSSSRNTYRGFPAMRNNYSAMFFY